MEYTTQFQMYITRTDWNKKALMALYQKGLKAKVQDILIFIENADSIKELINQAVKINNQIYQREQIVKGQKYQ